MSWKVEIGNNKRVILLSIFNSDVDLNKRGSIPKLILVAKLFAPICRGQKFINEILGEVQFLTPTELTYNKTYLAITRKGLKENSGAIANRKMAWIHPSKLA